MKEIPRRLSSRVILAGMAVALTLAGAACSSSSTSSGGAATGSTSDPAASTSSGGTAVFSSKTVGVMNVVGSSEALDHWTNTAVTALKYMGVKVDEADGQGSPQQWANVLTSFVSEHVNAIITVGGFVPTTVTPQLKAVKAAGIPIVGVGNPVQDPYHLMTAQYAPSDQVLGATVAEYLVKKLPPGSEYVDLNVPSAITAVNFIVAADQVMKAAGFKLVGTADMDPAKGSYPTQASNGAASLLLAHPDAKALISCCDFTPAATVPALRSAGFSKVINAARYDNLSTLQLIRGGAPVVVSAVNNDTGVLTGVGQVLNYLAHGTMPNPAAGNGIYQFTVVDSSNVPKSGFYYNPVTQIQTFEAKWKQQFG
jgi:ABC-type sugar transport system substrate-binding protein